MPRLRRLFADGLPERMERLRRGLDGVASDVAAGRGPSPEDLEDLFLASHSLKGTAPGFGALTLGADAAALSDLVQEWGPDAPPAAPALARARELVDRVAAGCDEVIARVDAGAGAESWGF